MDPTGLTRRRFVRNAAGAGAALMLPGILAEWARTAADGAGSAATSPSFRDADYWAFADQAAPMLDRYWSPVRRHYAVPGGGETSVNANLLYLHAAAAHAGHRGACRDDARARALAVRLLDDPPCRVPAGASAAAVAASASCSASERARVTGDQTHDWGWGATMGTTGGQHAVIDTAVVRALAMAYTAREEIGLTAPEAAHIQEHVRAAAYNAFYFYPALRLNQVNWPIEIYAAAADVTGDERLLRNDCRAQLSRFARGLTGAVAPWRIPFTGAGYHWHYLPQYSDRHPRNLDSAEYATIVSQAVMFYDRARAGGMPALDGSEVATIRAWLERVLCGYWTHAGYLIVIGSPLGLTGAAGCSGAAHVLFGPFTPGTLDLKDDAAPGMTISGARCREYAGTSVAAAGDVNGDGLDDVVIGAPGGSPDDEGLATRSGRAYVVFGRRAGGSVDLSRLGRLGMAIEGRRRAVTDAFGWSVDGAGDVDRDGFDDVVIAAPGNPGFEERSQRGAAYIVYGRPGGGTVHVRRLGRRGFRIASTGPGGLRSVAGAGDVDGDGRDDVVLGDVTDARGRGAAVVVRGARRRGVVRLGRLGRAGFRLTGRDRGAETGYAVDGGGDVNGDGLPDVIVGAPQGNRTPFNTAGGGTFVVFGRRSPTDVDLRALGTRGIEVRGAESDWAGFAVASAGRIGGDRRGDVALLVRGSLAVVFGRGPAGTVRLDGLGPAAGYLIDGTIEPNQWYSDRASGGFITAGAVGGDADGDGTDDLLVGVRMADHNDRPDSGSAYLIFSGR